jgi:hypothetical protein
MKKFIGYYIIGANTYEDAKAERGLLLWSESKPSFFKRLFNALLLGIYWIDKPRTLADRGKTSQSLSGDTDKAYTEMHKFTPVNGDVQRPVRKNNRPKPELKN